jgi:diketogulonate reductase-like aldo/keto reductase
LRNEDCLKGVYEAIKLGYRHIDTASIYRNEPEIAKVLADKSLSIKREELFITSKISPSE